MSRTKGPTHESAKRKALTILKEKKMYEQQREQISSQQLNIMQQSNTVTSMQDTVTQVQAMTAANKDMKTMFKKKKELKIDNIEKLQDDMMDMQDMYNEIQDVLGQNYNAPEIDDEELMGELDALEMQLEMEGGLDEGVGGVGVDATPSYLQDLPVAPGGGGVAVAEEEADEFGLPVVQRS
jgi:charged multivesicular body protein 5